MSVVVKLLVLFVQDMDSQTVASTLQLGDQVAEFFDSINLRKVSLFKTEAFAVVEKDGTSLIKKNICGAKVILIRFPGRGGGYSQTSHVRIPLPTNLRTMTTSLFFVKQVYFRQIKVIFTIPKNISQVNPIIANKFLDNEKILKKV